MSKDRLVLGGRFKLLRHLGGGGMSEVFLAEQLSLGRKVALKVLKRDLGSMPAMSERFRREAQLLSTVDHPSVVRVIDFETSPKDGTVLVLELAEGETLELALRLGPFEPGRAIRVFLQLAEGLAAIHDKGIIHRDIKPQNVVIGHSTRGEQARLLDFGIARLMELEAEETKAKPAAVDGDPEVTGPLPPVDADPFVSHPGQAVGTPAYVAPEQAMAQPVDPRTDIYSFGVLAFRALAGRLPFEGPSTRDYLEQHVKQKPPRLDEVEPTLAEWPALVKLVMQCLEKKPDARPDDGHALARSLKACLPAEAIPLTTQTRLALNAMATQSLSAVKGTVDTLGERGRAGARRVRKLAALLDKQTRVSLLITVLLTSLVPAAWAMWPPTPVEQAEQRLEDGDAAGALQLIDETLPDAKGLVPTLLSLKAAALHQLGRADDERALLRDLPYQVLFPARRPLLQALAEDFSDAEGDGELKELLGLVPAQDLDPVFERFAKEPLSRRQWGALRWLDLSGRSKGLDLEERYSASLASRSCTVRAKAAVRLGELGDTDAIGPLRDLSETPKDEGTSGPINCGQDEAAEAIRQLKKLP
ncbi:MAG: serine/threonine protein kinase [Myxococcales bacterium]|nr:serine/threonine protein kinase [Myxococcales bacterium]